MKKFHKKPSRFVKQVCLRVTDIERSLQFYQDIVGFKILSQKGREVILTVDGKTPLVILEEPDRVLPKEKRTTGLYHFALLLPSRTDLGSFLKHLLEKEYRLGAADHQVSEAIYIDDPDGNGIEIYRDRPADEWKWSNEEVKMTTDPLDGEGLLAEAGDWNGLPESTIMGHVHLHVKNLAETEAFYEKGLGFKVVTRYPGTLFMSTNDYHHHFGLNVWNGEGAPAPKEDSAGLNWMTIVLEDEAARDEVVRNLQEMGASVEKNKDIVITADPSGNKIHLVV